MIKQQTIRPADLQQALEKGALLLTANKRLAESCRRLYEQAQLEKGHAVWPTPQIMPWSAWLQTLWEAVIINTEQALPMVLNTAQEQLLWKQVISESLKDNPLQQINSTLRRAQQAWQLLQSWQLPLSSGVFSVNSDTAAFYQWANAFTRLCRKNNWLSAAQLASALTEEPAAQALAAAMHRQKQAGGEMLLLGFDLLTPQQDVLLKALLEDGLKVKWLQQAGREPAHRPLRLACKDTRDELGLMARWVRQCLAENPQAGIGVVVPELSAQRDMIVQALDRILVPEALLPGAESVARPYNISLGRPLSQYPVIACALQVLRLLRYETTLAELSPLLLSPYIAGYEEESSARALLDRRLRETGELNISVNSLRFFAAQQEQPHYCPQLLAQLDHWLQLQTEAKEKQGGSQPAGYWPDYFSLLLKALGWPLGRSLNSEEYQAACAWQELLGEFAALEVLGRKMRLSEAVAQLARMADERIFQPQTGALPVQVLGLLEAEEQQFDHLWVCGLHDGAWPPPAKANPFIPLSLQREQRLPQASEAQALAKHITRALLASADSVIVSYPLREGEAELGPSPLILELDTIAPEDLDCWRGSDSLQLVHQSRNTESLADDPAPALNEAVERAGGGSQIFKLQAACPFRAFAEQRLGARPFAQAEIGLNAMVRGSLVHRVLEKFWSTIQTQQQLLQLDEDALKAMIAQAVGEATEEQRRFYPQTLKGRFLELEKKRLQQQAQQWLALEKQRAPFRVIAKEQRYQLRAGGIEVRLFIDRIDALDDGRLVLIDYKTGNVSAAQWFGERPDEPQLPLYSMAVEGELAAVCFGQIRAGEIKFKGVSAEEGLLPAVKSWEKLGQTKFEDSWQQVLANWRSGIERLGESFRQGNAEVDPKRYPGSCEYCDLTALCRINEQSLLDENGADSVEAGNEVLP